MMRTNQEHGSGFTVCSFWYLITYAFLHGSYANKHGSRLISATILGYIIVINMEVQYALQPLLVSVSLTRPTGDDTPKQRLLIAANAHSQGMGIDGNPADNGGATMTRIQELQAKIKAVRAAARAEVAQLTNELTLARDAWHAERKAKADAKAQAKADRQAAKLAKATIAAAKLEAFIAANSTQQSAAIPSLGIC